jgi:hypothetical protein
VEVYGRIKREQARKRRRFKERSTLEERVLPQTMQMRLEAESLPPGMFRAPA